MIEDFTCRCYCSVAIWRFEYTHAPLVNNFHLLSTSFSAYRKCGVFSENIDSVEFTMGYPVHNPINLKIIASH